MKKLILLTSSFPYKGGEQFIETEIHYLSETFDEITIIPAQKRDGIMRPIPANVKVDDRFAMLDKSIGVRLRTVLFSREFYQDWKFSVRYLRFLFTWVFYARIFERFIEQNYENEVNDSLFYSYWFNFFPVGLYFLKRNHSKLEYISRAHRTDLYEEENGILSFPFRNKVLKNCKHIYSISKDGVMHLNKKYPGYDNKISISRLGTIDFGINPSIEKSGFRIVSCSGLSPVKRVHLIIESLAKINSRIEWVHFGDGVLHNKIHDLARKLLERKENIKFDFKGNVSNKEVFKYYASVSVDLFINVSSSEGIPVSIMEAMSFGIPVLATDVGGVKEIVNEMNGWLLKKDITGKDVAEKLNHIFQLNKNLEDKRVNSKYFWAKNYDGDRNYVDFMQKIIRN